MLPSAVMPMLTTSQKGTADSCAQSSSSPRQYLLDLHRHLPAHAGTLPIRTAANSVQAGPLLFEAPEAMVGG